MDAKIVHQFKARPTLEQPGMWAPVASDNPLTWLGRLSARTEVIKGRSNMN